MGARVETGAAPAPLLIVAEGEGSGWGRGRKITLSAAGVAEDGENAEREAHTTDALSGTGAAQSFDKTLLLVP